MKRRSATKDAMGAKTLCIPLEQVRGACCMGGLPALWAGGATARAMGARTLCIGLDAGVLGPGAGEGRWVGDSVTAARTVTLCSTMTFEIVVAAARAARGDPLLRDWQASQELGALGPVILSCLQRSGSSAAALQYYTA